MKVIIIGASGQLGSDIVKAFGENALPMSHDQIEVKDIESCRRVLKDAEAVINCAAYVKVDDCEDHFEEAFAINGMGAKNVATVCSENELTNIYISTDFVFDGIKRTPYQEDDPPDPINVYGLSKYAGEILSRNYCKNTYIIRSSSLFGVRGARGKGGNFVDWMVEKANKREEIKVVNDIVMSPTYTRDAAAMIRDILEKKLPFGIYHVSNYGFCTWYEFTNKIFEYLNVKVEITPIKSSELDRKAKRPLYTALESGKLSKLGLEMRTWEDALKAYLKEKGHMQ